MMHTLGFDACHHWACLTNALPFPSILPHWNQMTMAPCAVASGMSLALLLQLAPVKRAPMANATTFRSTECRQYRGVCLMSSANDGWHLFLAC